MVRLFAEVVLLGVVAGACVWVAGCGDETSLLDSSDPEQIIKGIRACGRSKDPAVVDRVSQFITHQDTMVAAEAIRCLGRLREPEAVAVLIEVATGERGRRDALRQEAVTQLGRQRQAEERALETFRQVVKMDPDPRVRAAAAVGIARLRSLVDVPLLLDVAESETDPIVERTAVGAIESMLGARFGYDPTASRAERDEALRRMRRFATLAAAATLKREKGDTETEMP